MEEQSNSYILSALAEISEEEWARLMLTVQKWFGHQLQNIQSAPSPEDLLHETVEDLINGTRSWPQERVSLIVCLRTIVRSKANHVLTKAALTEHVHVTDEVLEWNLDPKQTACSEREAVESVAASESVEDETIAELRSALLQGNSYGPPLQQALEYWVNHLHDDVTARQLAEALQLPPDGGKFKALYRESESIVRAHLKDIQEQGLRKMMLECVRQDEELLQILTYRFSNPDAKARDIASALKVSTKIIYNAARRLKTNPCLEGLYKHL